MNSIFPTQIFDVLILGQGLAGRIAALSAIEAGAGKVALVGLPSTASDWAQGGIVYQGEGDPDKLREDLLEAGCKENFQPAVEMILKNGPLAVRKWLLENAKIPFDRVGGRESELDLNLEAAHQSHRILHCKDSTGSAIMAGLGGLLNSERVKNKITFIDAVAVELLLSNRNDERQAKVFSASRVCGAYCFSRAHNEVGSVVSKTTILATGGFSSLFLHSTGPSTSRGDGIALAHRAGARTLGLEYVQFHPTALFLPNKPRKLLTEALRGEGAKLLNSKHEPFVDELAPRDRVSRAIHSEIMKSDLSHVWLDLTPIENLENRFPAVCKLLSEQSLDPKKQLIPVVPAAHYTLGGVWTDLEGKTNLPGLYACGEVACTGVHGANRLASTSLLEALVWGESAGIHSAMESKNMGTHFDFIPRSWESESQKQDPALLTQDWQLLRQTLWNYMGLVRTERRLRRAEKILVELRTEIESFYKKAEISDELLGLRNGVLVATLTLYAALRNRRSVGTHYLDLSES